MNYSHTATYPTPSFPPAQASLSANDHGMREDYVAQGAQDGVPRDNMHSLQDIRPYLGLRSRLSQVWINRWSVLIILVLVRVLLSLSSLRNGIDDAQDQALAACTTVESMGSVMASLPHYSAAGFNELAATGVEHAVNGLHSGLFDIVTAAEEIFVFWVNMYIGLYECLITFAVTGSAKVLLDAAEDTMKFLNDTMKTVTGDMGTAIDGFQDAYNKFLGALNSASSIFGGGKAPAKLDLSSEIGTLQHLQIPTTVTDDIEKMKANIPTFDEVKNTTNNLLRLPFEEIKKLMNESLGTYNFDRNVFPVPEREQMKFCEGNNGITDFFDDLYKIAETAKKIFIGVLVVAAIAACIPMGYLEIRKWRSQQTYASRMQAYSVDNIDKVYIASRPYTSYGGIKISQKFSNQKMQLLMRWFVAYMTSVPALVLLSLALAGLFSCVCQYAILKSVEKEVPALANEVGDFADQVVNSLTAASVKWANGTNTVINNTNAKINHDVFGWVNTSTHAVNDTLNTFVDGMQTILNKTFGNTPLYEPIEDVFKCLVGLKVEAVQTGLTWVSDHAYIALPMLPNNTLSAGAQASISTNKTSPDGQNNSFLASPGDEAADKITQAVTKLADRIAAGIRQEAIIATSLLALYGVLLLMGLGRVVYSMIRGGKNRAEGGATYAGDVAPGSVDDNTRGSMSRAAGSTRPSSGTEMRELRPSPTGSPPPHAMTAADAAPTTREVSTTRGGPVTDTAPPAYEKRFPAFQSTYPLHHPQDDEQEYQDEKLGYANTGGSQNSANNPFQRH